MADEKEIVKSLIRESRLIQESEKAALMDAVDSLNPEELKKARLHLEGESDFVLKTFGSSIKNTLEKQDDPKFVEAMKQFFADAKRSLLKAREADERVEESPENILEQLNDAS